MKPRNVIILHSDEMRADCTGFGGHRSIATPRLDAFARSGTVFASHFTVHGKCVPSRVAMMTARYAHSDAIRTVNDTNLIPADQPDLMKVLRAAGYETAVFGHNHCWDQFWGVDNQPGTAAVDHHSYQPRWKPFLDRRHPVPDPGRVTPPAGLNDGHDWHGPAHHDLTGFCDDNRADQAMAFLRGRSDPARPFFLQLNLSRPHPAYEVEQPYWGRHDRAALAMPPMDLPLGATLPLAAQRRWRTGMESTEPALREAHATYLGMIEKVDVLMGRVLDTIAELGLFDDSIVVFTSDHGDFAGQYGLCEKFDTVFADCLLQVPFAIRAPGLPQGRTVTGLSEHIDLPGTMLELLGMGAPADWLRHGRSLVAQAHGAPGAAAIFADGGHEAAMRARFNRPVSKLDPHSGREVLITAGKQRTYQQEPDSMARAMMVRTTRHKLVLRETGGDELYDLSEDRYEMRNRFGDPLLARVQAELTLRLARWNLRTMPDRPLQETVGA